MARLGVLAGAGAIWLLWPGSPATATTPPVTLPPLPRLTLPPVSLPQLLPPVTLAPVRVSAPPVAPTVPRLVPTPSPVRPPAAVAGVTLARAPRTAVTPSHGSGVVTGAARPVPAPHGAASRPKSSTVAATTTGPEAVAVPETNGQLLARTARELGLPLGIAGVVGVFIAFQGWADRRDPKLRDAPVWSEEIVPFL